MTMNKIIDLYLKNNSSTSKSTKITLLQGLKRLEKIKSKKFDDLTSKDFENVDNTIDEVTEMYSLNTTISTILAINKFLDFKTGNKELILKYKEILNELIKKRNSNQITQTFKNDEKDNWIDYLKLKSMVEKFSVEYLNKKKSFTDYRNFLILSLFVLIPPARIGNYLDMIKKDDNIMKQKIDSLPKKYNYIVKTGDTYTLIFNQYKTSKILGKVKYNIKNNILNNLLKKYLEDYNNLDKNKFFMINKSGKPMSQTNFTNSQGSITKKLFKKQITNNMFRRIFFTWFLSTNPSIQEKMTILKISGQNYKASTVEKYDRSESINDSKEVNNDVLSSNLIKL